MGWGAGLRSARQRNARPPQQASAAPPPVLSPDSPPCQRRSPAVERAPAPLRLAAPVTRSTADSRFPPCRPRDETTAGSSHFASGAFVGCARKPVSGESGRWVSQECGRPARRGTAGPRTRAPAGKRPKLPGGVQEGGVGHRRGREEAQAPKGRLPGDVRRAVPVSGTRALPGPAPSLRSAGSASAAVD